MIKYKVIYKGEILENDITIEHAEYLKKQYELNYKHPILIMKENED